MKRVLLALAVLMAFFAAQGCGGGGGGAPQAPQQVTTTIASNQNVDGYLTFDPASQTVQTPIQVKLNAVPSIFAGIDPATLKEFRAFLDFPLASIPSKAVIQFAQLNLVLRSTTLADGSNTPLPLRIELVQFPPPLLLSSYFTPAGLTTLAELTPVSPSIVPPITQGYVGPLAIDVSQLVATAHGAGFSDFQIRILENQGSNGAAPGVIEIDENSSTTSPSLIVKYQQ